MRVLVTGSRKWAWPGVVEGSLDILAKEAAAAGDVLTVVHGCAFGADMAADGWAVGAVRRGLPVRVERHLADWQTHGRRAGVLRNQEMVRLGADVCLAFILDASRGATGCADMAERAGIAVQRVEQYSHEAGGEVLP